MKLFLLICVLVATVVADRAEEAKEKLKQFRQECNTETGHNLDEAAIDNALKNHDIDKAVFGPYSVCMAKKMGLSKENGDVDSEKIRLIVGRTVTDTAKLDRIVEKCSAAEATKEETYIKVFKCLYRSRPKDQH